MKLNKETLIGIIAALSLLGLVSAATGVYGVFYVGLAGIVAVISFYLFSRKSIAARTGAVILNTDLIYKILMPSKYRKSIKELEEKERNSNSD